MKMDMAKLSVTPRNYPDFLGGYMDYTSCMEAPTAFHIWTALSVIGGALGGKCYFDMGTFRWKPNQFIVLVAPPGVVSKSTTSAVGYNLLKEVPGINFGPSSCTWQAMLDEFEDIEQKYKVGKEEKVMSAMSMQVSELGTFLNFQDTEMIDTIVDIWDAADRQLKRRTKGGGVQTIESPWLNMMGCTTPSWISNNVPEYAIGGGFVSRTLFIYADKKQRAIPYPKLEQNPHHATHERKLREDLARISMLHGEFKITDEALEWGSKWYHNHVDNPPAHLKTPLLQGYAARKQCHMHKIAMCLSASESDSMMIEARHLQRAESLLNLCETNMRKVFQVVSDDKEARFLEQLVRMLLSNPKGLTETELRWTLKDTMSGSYVERAIMHGVQAGMLTTKRKKDQNDPMYVLTPKVLEENLSASADDIQRVKQMVKEETGV